MLILARKRFETIVIGDNVVAVVLPSRSGSLKIGISAPPQTRVLRGELLKPDDPGFDEIRTALDQAGAPLAAFPRRRPA